MARFREIREEFRSSYRDALDRLVEFDAPTLVLTIYNPRYGLEGYPEAAQLAAEGALSAFNDVIQQEAIHSGFDVLDIRKICVSDDDYANPIEPSDTGGRKIARQIANWLEAPSDCQEKRDV